MYINQTDTYNRQNKFPLSWEEHTAYSVTGWVVTGHWSAAPQVSSTRARTVRWKKGPQLCGNLLDDREDDLLGSCSRSRPPAIDRVWVPCASQTPRAVDKYLLHLLSACTLGPLEHSAAAGHVFGEAHCTTGESIDYVRSSHTRRGRLVPRKPSRVSKGLLKNLHCAHKHRTLGGNQEITKLGSTI